MNSEQSWWAVGMLSFGISFGYWYGMVLAPFGALVGLVVSGYAFREYEQSANSGNPE